MRDRWGFSRRQEIGSRRGCRDELPEVSLSEEGVRRLANPEAWGGPGVMEVSQGEAVKCRERTWVVVQGISEPEHGEEGGLSFPCQRRTVRQ